MWESRKQRMVKTFLLPYMKETTFVEGNIMQSSWEPFGERSHVFLAPRFYCRMAVMTETSLFNHYFTWFWQIEHGVLPFSSKHIKRGFALTTFRIILKNFHKLHLGPKQVYCQRHRNPQGGICHKQKNRDQCQLAPVKLLKRNSVSCLCSNNNICTNIM